MKPISDRDRELIVAHKQNGKKGKEIAEWLMICEQTVSRIWRKFLTTGSYEPAPRTQGRKPKVSEDEMDAIIAKIEEQPDITLNELIEEFSLSISESALSKRLKKANLTYKKRLFIQKSKNDWT